MTKKIEAYLATDKTYFVITGAGHMVGAEGIVELLRKKKVSVSRLAKMTVVSGKRSGALKPKVPAGGVK